MLEIKKIRSDFPILSQTVYDKPLVYFDNAATTHKPLSVIDKIVDFYKNKNSNIHRGVHFLSEQASEAFEFSRRCVQSFINAEKCEEIVFTKGTTESINLVAHSFGSSFVKAGDEILITELEHHANILPWQAMCEQKGAFLKVLPVDKNGLLEMDRLSECITKRTKLIAVTMVSNALGLVSPVKKIINQAHKKDIPVLLDAAQAIQHSPIDVKELDCDFLVFSGHKMYAETGIGILYGKEKWLEQMPPYQLGGGMIEHVRFDKTTFARLPLKFEAGTGNIAGAISMQAAIEYMETIGLASIEEHETRLIDQAIERISRLEGITVYGGAAKKSGVFSFNFKNVHPYDVGMVLDKLGIAVRTGMHCAEPLMVKLGIPGTIRASVALYNTSDDIEKLVEGLKRARKLLAS